MKRMARIVGVATAALVIGTAAHADVTLNSVRIAAADTVMLARFYQSAFGMHGNRVELIQRPAAAR